ncbi:MAG: argininosuccinate lyase, partial [Clostridia bacterium]|nr:argininosuccinate lyase [Clostridia bacterium]
RRGETLETLPLADYLAVCDLFEDDVYEAISLETCVNQRRVIGAPCPDNVRAQAKRMKELAL